MKLKVFSVYDSKIESFMKPFFMQATGAAIRGFADACNDPESSISKHPEDYTLFEIAEYDDQDAKFETYSTPKSLGVGVQFLINNEVSS